MAECKCGSAAKKKEEQQLEEILAQYKNEKGALITALQKVQEFYGYLPEEGMQKVAEAFDMPESKVFGVATFYAQFHLQPRGEWVIRVCTGTACHVRGAEKIMNKLIEELNIEPGETTEDLKFTLEPVACIGCCGLAPVIMVNDNTHGRLVPDQIPEILDKYK
ncbi:NADH-quinone oxidoreductase subunit NuoE [Natranaerobius thermophilus]|uniref:NADH-quinone oxidoreductase, E subunit n=1 Tax=Natranaerobius thermophilus (strain ATCC BAA-1301 / DSM 18059 / JW/NM-WN-LF) TaxID=457570 RepID=B2A3R9_NATTJ|nr:NADH-quinone oxidoreductase subunit NuoE [Natranaerobius thermophilus]ACB83695.1 NADH-quinone oxidoreductase, E subunit [Natranaerobius thermophilus JW/NM-WN-LF]